MLFHELNAARSEAFMELLTVPAVCPRSPIFSIQIAEPRSLATFLQEDGIMVRAVVPPTVPEGTSRVRICLHAGNTETEIKSLVTSMEAWILQQPHPRKANKASISSIARL